MKFFRSWQVGLVTVRMSTLDLYQEATGTRSSNVIFHPFKKKLIFDNGRLTPQKGEFKLFTSNDQNQDKYVYKKKSRTIKETIKVQ